MTDDLIAQIADKCSFNKLKGADKIIMEHHNKAIREHHKKSPIDGSSEAAGDQGNTEDDKLEKIEAKMKQEFAKPPVVYRKGEKITWAGFHGFIVNNFVWSFDHNWTG